MGYTQIGQEMFVIISLTSGPLTFNIAVPIFVAKEIARELRDTAETAEVQIIKPPSMLAQA
jgi:hypothetical protein